MLVSYDSKLLHDWNQTALLASIEYNLITVVINAVSKKANARPRTPDQFNPYKRQKRQGLVINSNNFSILKMIGNQLCARKK